VAEALVLGREVLNDKKQNLALMVKGMGAMKLADSKLALLP
jgi:hypothetical protein